MEETLNHRYFTRSKKNIDTNLINKNKNESDKNELVNSEDKNKIVTPALKYYKTFKSKYDDSNRIKIKIMDKSILKTFFDKLKLNTLYDEDEEYIPIVEGLPKEIEYIEPEENYIKKLEKDKVDNIIKIEKEILSFKKNTIPIRFKILNSNLDICAKSYIIDKLDYFYRLETTDNEFNKLNTWIETLEKIPFDSYSKNIINKQSTSEDKINYIKNVKQILDNSVYGHDVAKNQVLQLIAQQITNPNCKGNCISIQGPPGNGKTTLVREGICKAIKRPFFSIALGGLQNSDFLLGHEYTYEGSKPGKIIEILIQSKSMDPVIFFDELDKLSETPKGQEIANLLCHLTDLSQNNSFQDKYFSGINIDLSRILFIFSYNDEKKINPILLDRMIKIKTIGFNTNDKIKISNKFLIPSVCKSLNFNIEHIIFKKNILNNIIANYTDSEKGVRNLRRCIESILSKINLLKLLGDNSDIISYKIKNLTFPYTLKEDDLKILIDFKKKINNYNLYI